MAVIATEGQYSRFSSLVKANDTPERFNFFTQLVTVNEGAQATYQLGTVLGKVTATGKYKISVQNAVDGSEVPVAIVLANSFGEVKDATIAAATDTKVLVLARGKVIVAKEALKLDASYDLAAEKQYVYDKLALQGILVEASA